MLSEPIISVITVCYNSQKYISTTIRSVLNQTYGHFEYIIIDDHSSDESWKEISLFKDPKIRAFRNETNLGEYANRSKAIDLASGKYVIFIDGDDLMYPNAIETFCYYIKLFPASSMFFTREWDPRIIYPFQVGPREIYRFEYLDGGIMGGNFTKVLFKRSEIVKAGYFPKNIATGDTYIQLKLALHNSGIAINDGLTWWRRRKGNATEKFFKNNRHLAETVNYKIDFLNNPDCPLPAEDVHVAKNNIYGLYLRSLIRMIVKLQWKDLLYLWKHVKIPGGYYKSILIPSKSNYFSNYNGDNPLHTPADYKPILNN